MKTAFPVFKSKQKKKAERNVKILKKKTSPHHELYTKKNKQNKKKSFVGNNNKSFIRMKLAEICH